MQAYLQMTPCMFFYKNADALNTGFYNMFMVYYNGICTLQEIGYE